MQHAKVLACQSVSAGLICCHCRCGERRLLGGQRWSGQSKGRRKRQKLKLAGGWDWGLLAVSPAACTNSQILRQPAAQPSSPV